ncbi:SRPBCC family protein [Lysobacter enzymogenes]|uniref:SRPBCC family protein n=1 Tax=Lysobacter enzymogenes TaxID=69 RepID=UPI001A96024A|nr:SRPBCC family protein [Lysobacter enzymogenes]QQP95853.1 SRPBCC family protein [Lysobacter enzymogenes]
MKALLKGLFYLIVLLAVVFAGGGLLLPDKSHVERSATIDRPPAQVYAMLDSFKRFNEWSPWYQLEPDAKYSYSGPDSGVGAGMAWEGKKVGRGSQRIAESVPQSKIAVALDFDGSQATATYTLVAEGEGTRVTWALDSDHGYNLMGRWIGLLMEKMVGKDYEQGLARLKQVLENDPR